jgi:hypothetical protein
MAIEVIMPALGMAQETGKLLTWLKEPGEAVQSGDVLFEVETDKSVSEVEAQSDGFLTDVSANPGEDVPVGQRIAMISETAQDTAPAPSTPQLAQPEPTPPEPTPKPPANPTIAATPIFGRVLASPKTKRLATEQGLDLSNLRDAGYPQPYHVSDLTTLRDLSTVQSTALTPVATHHITAEVPIAGLTAFLERMAAEGGVELPASAVLCNFAAAAWRGVTLDDSFTLRLARIGQPNIHLIDPDRFRLSAQPQDTKDTAVAMILRDLSGSAITSMQIGPATAPLINVASDATTYSLTFTFTPDQLADDAAVEFITELAARISDPLPYLV